MRISAQLLAIVEGIQPWAQSVKGSVEVATELNHLFAILSIKPGSFRAAVMWDRQEKRGLIEEASMVDNTYRVALSFGQSMQLQKGSALVYGESGGPPWPDLIEDCRDTLRQLDFDPDSTEVTVDYKSARPLTDINPDFLIDGWFLEISIGTILPQPD